MTRGRCQICGRAKRIRTSGGLVMHHVAGVPCEGDRHPPIEQADAWLADRVDHYWREYGRHAATIRALVARRANYIDPAIERARDRAFDRWSKLRRRLDRHRNWPARYRREMERDGMSMPPPAYLLERERNGEA